MSPSAGSDRCAEATLAPMGTYDSELADLRRRARSHYDVVRGPATLEQVQRLRAAVQARLGLRLPEAYESFLRACNGFRVDSGRVLGVDADLMASPPPDAPSGVLDGCLAFNLERREAELEAGIDDPFLYLAWYDEATWGVRPDGTCWERDPETCEDIESYRDCAHLLESVTRRIGGEI